MEKIIPIENIYYMLCYSWGNLKEKDLVNIENLAQKNLPNLFGQVLANAIQYLIKKGFDREYVNEVENISSLKGKILFNESLKNQTWVNGKMYCTYDDLTYDIIQNQIIKATINRLITSRILDNKIKIDLLKIYHHFGEINNIKIKNSDFKKVKIHKNNSYYSFIINICEILYKNLIPSENKGQSKFKDFLRDEKEMAKVFENFVRNFYKVKQSKFKVRREDILWNLEVYEGEMQYLPKMQTDITLENNEEKIIIDTKYYKEALKENYSKKFITSNLYQIFSYLGNVKIEENKKMSGVLLYPQVEEEIDFSSTYNKNFDIKIKTLNLNQSWEKIEKRLLELISNQGNCT